MRKDRNVILDHISNGISGKKIRSALAGILPQFEEGLRGYIESEGIMPIIRNGGKDIKISLSQMFNGNNIIVGCV